MGYSIAAREAVLNEALRGIAASWPATYYVILLTTNPTDDTGTGMVEVSAVNWTNYARVAVAKGTTTWNAPAGGTTSPQSSANTSIIDFGTATTTGNITITGWAMMDAASAGAMWFWGTFTTPPIVQNGNPVDFSASALVIDQ